MIAGIDFSSNAIDFVLLADEGAGATWYRRRLDARRGADSFQRARLVRGLLPVRGAWADAGVTQIVLEEPMTRSFSSAAALMRIQGAILSCLPVDMPVERLRPTEWKRETVGRAMASKDEVRAWASYVGGRVNHWMMAGMIPAPQDAIDAFAIAWAWRSLAERGTVVEAA